MHARAFGHRNAQLFYIAHSIEHVQTLSTADYYRNEYYSKIVHRPCLNHSTTRLLQVVAKKELLELLNTGNRCTQPTQIYVYIYISVCTGNASR